MCEHLGGSVDGEVRDPALVLVRGGDDSDHLGVDGH